MSKESKTARASAVRQEKSDPYPDNASKIRAIRDLRASGLAVNRPDFVDALLEEHDASQALAKALVEKIKIYEDEATTALSKAGYVDGAAETL
jgi:hypothetical protein